MGDLFRFSQEEVLAFFAVLVRFGTLIMVLPVTGDRMVPGPVKVLFALAVSIAVFPMLVSRGEILPGQALAWGQTTAGIIMTVGAEAIFGLTMGYAAKLCFDAIQVGGNFAGSFMGLAMAQHYDPHQETQSQVIAEIQMALAMLLFLALDGHHLMLKTAFDSYAIVGLGQLKFTEEFARRLIEITGQVLVIGLQIAGPVGLSIFAVNVGFGIMGKAMPNLNILVLSLGVTCLIGLLVVFLSTPHLVAICAGVFERMSLWMRQLMLGLVAHGR